MRARRPRRESGARVLKAVVVGEEAREVDGRTVRPTSMIGWTDDEARVDDVVPDDLTWGDVIPPCAQRPLDEDLDVFLGAADAGTLEGVIARLSDASVLRWGCDAVVWLVDRVAQGGARELRVRTRDGVDDVSAATDLAAHGHDALDESLRVRLGVCEVTTAALPLGDLARCAVWFGWRAPSTEPRHVESSLLRAMAMSLRDVLLTERLTLAQPARRDRREVAIGRLMRAAAPSLMAAHASLASTHASLEAELVGLRVMAPLSETTRVCSALMADAWDNAQLAWEAISAVSFLADESTERSDPLRVANAVAALVRPYVARRARVDVARAEVPMVRVVPAWLAEVLVMLTTRIAVQFEESAEGGASACVRLRASLTARGVAIEIGAVGGVLAATSQHDNDQFVGELYDRELAQRCGGAVEVGRDALGATTFRVIVPV